MYTITVTKQNAFEILTNGLHLTRVRDNADSSSFWLTPSNLDERWALALIPLALKDQRRLESYKKRGKKIPVYGGSHYWMLATEYPVNLHTRFIPPEAFWRIA